MNPLQVRIAESQAERENKLFIGMLPKTIDEDDLHSMFAPYGELREVHIIRGPEGSSKGCAFVKFVDRDAAMVAIEDMNELIPPVSKAKQRHNTIHALLFAFICPVLVLVDSSCFVIHTPLFLEYFEKSGVDLAAPPLVFSLSP